MAVRYVMAGALACLGVSTGSLHAQIPDRPWHQIAGIAGDSGVARPARDWIAAELAVGNWARARELLLESGALSPQGYPDHFDLWATASLGAGQLAEAASWFAVEGELATGVPRAIAFARAGQAYEALGWDSAAEQYYRRARAAGPGVAGWLALRIARVSEDSLAGLLLREVPVSASQMRQSVGAQIQLRRGNWSGAADILRRIGHLDSAIAIAARAGDSSLARGWAIEALETESNSNRRAALEFLADSPEPPTVGESTRLAAAAIAIGDNSAAIGWATAALARGDSSATALRLLGRAQERSGRRSEALESYRASGERGGDDGILSRYSRGRLLLALHRDSDGIAELIRFTEEFPGHSYTAAALESVAGGLATRGDLDAADSVVDLLHRSRPRSAEASSARMQLAQAAAASDRTETEERWYLAEVEAQGRDRHFARYLLSKRKMGTGDTAAALALLEDLVAADPLGYYGSRARIETGRPLPVFEDVERGAPSQRITGVLEQLDFLQAAGFAEEAEAHLSFWVSYDSLTTDEVLDLAAGLTLRGEISRVISLGWRASRTAGLNDLRVVRAIFPWPFRHLIEVEALEFEVDPYLVAAIVRQESAFDPDATSRAGARGLMQLMPATASWRARQGGYPWDADFLGLPDANLHIGIGHLADLLRRSDDIVYALAAYNAGGGNIARWRRREGMNDPETFVEKIPFAETRGYVKAILRNRDIYRALYPGS